MTLKVFCLLFQRGGCISKVMPNPPRGYGWFCNGKDFWDKEYIQALCDMRKKIIVPAVAEELPVYETEEASDQREEEWRNE